mgnify:CR=1 FL=1
MFSTNSTSTDDNKEWIENFMSDNSYKIVNNEGGGDCLFAVIRDALSSVGDKVTVNELREKLAEEATNEIFLGYKLSSLDFIVCYV